MPLLLIAAVMVIIVPTLLRKKSTNGPNSASTRAGLTIEAIDLIDKGEQAYKAAHGRFTPHLADLLTPRLASALAIGLIVRIDVGTDGQRYLAQVESDLLGLVRGRNNAVLTAQSCRVLKSSSGVACPLPAK
jgi:hypothetical protein